MKKLCFCEFELFSTTKIDGSSAKRGGIDAAAQDTAAFTYTPCLPVRLVVIRRQERITGNLAMFYERTDSNLVHNVTRAEPRN